MAATRGGTWGGRGTRFVARLTAMVAVAGTAESNARTSAATDTRVSARAAAMVATRVSTGIHAMAVLRAAVRTESIHGDSGGGRQLRYAPQRAVVTRLVVSEV